MVVRGLELALRRWANLAAVWLQRTVALVKVFGRTAAD
jgi:hypothetical protein